STHTIAPGEYLDTPDIDVVATLKRLGRIRKLAPRETLRAEHADDPNLYLIESGALKLSLITNAGDELIIGLFFEGDVLGLQHLYDTSSNDVATALEPTRVFVLPLNTLQRVRVQEDTLQQQLLRLASQRIAQLQQHILAVARHCAIERVASFVIELARRRTTKPGDVVWLPLSLHGIGCYLNLSLETVCRALRQLEHEGVIRKRGRAVQILDTAHLADIAGGISGGAPPSQRKPIPMPQRI
ncbi:MAG: Crp/Fnr family transcriptional regulator, partial [Gammaproteobacteria bacterium]|nr:Crp/Fnr family transcriptional regulator [Gammaproteobacteria bacterium]